VRLASVHRTAVELPGHEVQPVLLAGELGELGPGDVIIWGEPGSPTWKLDVLQGTGAVVLALDLSAVLAARQCGLAAFLVPDLSAEVLLRAIQPGALAAVETGTLLADPPTLWTPGRATPLPPHEALVLGALLEGPASRELLHQRLGLASSAPSRAADALVARLRRRLGRRHIVRTRGGGWQLVPLSQALPTRLEAGPSPIDLGPVKIDLVRRLVWDGERQRALTRLDVALLDELVRVPGPVPREVLARAWGRPVDRESIDLAIHRLRRKLGHDLVLTVRGHGYQLRRTPAPPDLASVLVELLREPQLVALIGPPGVGKSAVAARVAEQMQIPRLDLHGVDSPQAEQALGRHAGPLVLDGLSAEVVLPGGRPLLVTAWGAPAGAQRVLRMEPWSTDALSRAFPRASAPELAAADGLPGALAAPDELHARVRQAPGSGTLARLASYDGPFPETDAAALVGAPALEVLLARSLLERAPDGQLRLLRPLREAVCELAQPQERLRWARQVVERARAHLQVRPFEPEPVQRHLPDLSSACALLLEPEATLLQLELEPLGATADKAALARVIERTDDPWLRAELGRGLGRALQREGELDSALATYIEAAYTGSLSTACRAWLGAASVLASMDRLEEGWAALELAERFLTALEDPLCRISALLQRAEMGLQAGQPAVAVTAATDGLGRLVRERWTAGSPLEADGYRTLLLEARLHDTLGEALSRLGRPEAAAAAQHRARGLHTRLRLPP
jgi:tetratricopeptide (TPR) repeat protein